VSFVFRALLHWEMNASGITSIVPPMRETLQKKQDILGKKSNAD
jgi:hypothetical protein